LFAHKDNCKKQLVGKEEKKKGEKESKGSTDRD
jgi:hypothetical protein